MCMHDIISDTPLSMLFNLFTIWDSYLFKPFTQIQLLIVVFFAEKSTLLNISSHSYSLHKWKGGQSCMNIQYEKYQDSNGTLHPFHWVRVIRLQEFLLHLPPRSVKWTYSFDHLNSLSYRVCIIQIISLLSPLHIYIIKQMIIKHSEWNLRSAFSLFNIFFKHTKKHFSI